MIIKILGTGCSKCEALEKETKKALEELNLTAEIQKVTDLNEIMNYDVMITPALVVDEKVKSAGKALKCEEIKSLFMHEI